MNQLASQAWELVSAGDPARAVAFVAEPLPSPMGDAALVAQVWQNLLDNAFKYTAKTARPQVRIDSFDEAGRTWYRVTDNGVGFSMERAQHLFQPFQRMHTLAEFSGTGIGLSLVRRVARAHGGEVRAKSQPGVGTVIEFCLVALA